MRTGGSDPPLYNILMEGPVIEATVALIQMSELGRVPEEDQIWEEIDGEACIAVTRHIYTSKEDGATYEMVVLQVSGEPSERTRVMNEFYEVFGTQAQIDYAPEDSDEPDTVFWVIR